MSDPSWMEGPPSKECYICLAKEDGYDTRGDWNEWGDAHVSCEQELIELVKPDGVFKYNGRIVQEPAVLEPNKGGTA